MNNQPAKPDRRWLRFSLGSLLLFIAVIGGWMGLKANRAQKQMRAVQAVLKLGGTVSYDYESNGSSEPAYPGWFRSCVPHDFLATARVVRLERCNVSDEDLVVLAGLPDLVMLDLQYTQVGDAGLKNISGLTKLQVLILTGTKCTDTGLKSLKSMILMSLLDLRLTQVSDEGLAVVKNMPNLSELNLGGTRVSNKCLVELQDLKLLSGLDVSHTEITETGLSHLSEIPGLLSLMVSRQLLTPNSIRQLRQFPKLKLIYFEPPDDWKQMSAEVKQELPGVQAIPFTFHTVPPARKKN